MDIVTEKQGTVLCQVLTDNAQTVEVVIVTQNQTRFIARYYQTLD
jgi:hypothetical protein